MGRRTRWSATVVATWLVASSLLAGTAAAQSGGGPSLDITIGIDGWVDPNRPTAATVEISSPELFVGQLDVVAARPVSTPVEIPAGGAKRYVIDVPPIGPNLQAVVHLRNADGDTVTTERIRLSAPSREVLVGVAGVDDILPAVRAATTTPAGRPVEAIDLDPADLSGGPNPLGYLVVSEEVAGSLDPEAVERIVDWIEDGGRLVGTQRAVEAIVTVGSGAPLPGTPAVVSRVGDGEAIVIDDPVILDETVWSALVRDVPPRGLVTDYSLQDLPFQLLSAATAGNEAAVPGLPWLLGGILLFVVLVGPANFLVLRALGRPEASWVTIPALSLLFVGGFWMIGRGTVSDVTVSHAAVVVEAAGETQGVAGVIVQVGEGGDHVLQLDEGWQAYPFPTGGIAPVQVAAGATGATVDFTLQDFGVAGVQTEWRPERVGLSASVRPADGEVAGTLTVDLENPTPWEFWAWGVIAGGRSSRGADTLEPGERVQTEVAAGRRIGDEFVAIIADAVFRRGFEPEPGLEFQFESRFQAVDALARYAESIADLRGGGVFVWGFTDDYPLELEVDGSRVTSTGRVLLVKEIDEGSVGTLAAVRPEIVSVVGAATIEGYGPELYMYGAREVTVRYLLPPSHPSSGRIDPVTTTFDTMEAWDWSGGGYAAVAFGDAIDLDRFVSPAGELVVRLSVSEDRGERDFEESFNLGRYSLIWETT